VVVYNQRGEVLAESSNLLGRFDPPPVPLDRVTTSNTGMGEYVTLGSQPMYVY
jgi:hypothetical protein